MCPSSPLSSPRLRVLSGIQPSGQLHLGNYFGSILPNLEHVGKAKESFFFIADLHALTTMHDAVTLKKAREDIVLDYLACGFDPNKAAIYHQSSISEHTELMWILSTVTPMGLLERAVSYKDKVQQGVIASAGLFTYPVLMAADILLYQAETVPVGRDQKQHVEIARDIAVKFNNLYGETFTVPEPSIRAEVAVVPGIDGRKMSKSYGNIIPLFATDEEVKKAIMGIVTDSKGMSAPKDPEQCTIYQLHKLFLSKEQAKALAEEYRHGLAYGEAKKRLFEAFMDTFGAVRAKRAKLSAQDAAQALEIGRVRAQKVATATMAQVYEAVGLR
ncbi:MAG: tryptophan--tRNA ligase [Candidatus Peribacteraceae bacterium]|nr:tryptophan--tRNA ligase [Candidatus Peribacteraceae bacterium]